MPQNTINILGIQTLASRRQSVINQIMQDASQSTPAYACLVNVHVCMEAFDNAEYRKVINDADYALADGKPIMLVQRLFGKKSAEQLRGADLMLAICQQSAKAGLSIGLYGSTTEVLGNLKEKLEQQFKGLAVTYIHSPPFRDLSEAEIATQCRAINERNVDILFVGLGCPKQEYWMSQYKNHTNCIKIGVGAAFDFISGQKPQAPEWIIKLGLEWLFRLITEPTRLTARYAKHNPRFVFYVLKQLLTGK